jgi:hypothetical protein
MKIEPNIKLENRGSDSVIKCPRCDQSYLHHEDIVVFDRGEDVPTLTQTKILGGKVEVDTVPSKTSGNPSGRRDGLVIGFTCESCEASGATGTIELTIAQHKGETFLAWRYE